ncbi:MAG: glutamine synthetase III [Eubacteriales bacterium]|jgi:glutamine synthetase
MIDYNTEITAENLPRMFGCMVFNDDVMRERLPRDIYKSLHKTIEDGRDLDITVANVVANAMRDWAIEHGATHFTHWFQPMTGITAEKHESFISPYGNGKIIMEFSGKELIRGEPDASSFPSGGLRETFEARGYTSWDPTSYAFIKDDSLCIPTAFCSFGGEVLDKKTPLLRSMNVISAAATRICQIFGYSDVTRVVPTAGAEQEYFLIDRSLYEKRLDLKLCGRTLFGARPPKGQELEDHYYGAIRPRVIDFMQDLNRELWKLGIYAKTEHNESAPAQHELAPIYGIVNAATDHNQLTMEFLKKVAERHNMACLLSEKPFAGINGSGKHNNWSLSTNTGINLFDPGTDPSSNKLFLIFVAAVIQAVDEHQDLLRISVASAGNDQRLGSNEAPPSIISIFLGDEITEILECIADGRPYNHFDVSNMDTGVKTLPEVKKDTSDRNRTSPFAFTGNKFEFRMLGSSNSISGSNTILNTIVADVLEKFAERLENADNTEDEYRSLICETYNKHSRIIFNGNNYSTEWVEEAERRGLLNLKSTPDALPMIMNEENIRLFTKHRIYTERELRARYEILVENYIKVINIEALTMLDISNRQLIPAAMRYTTEAANGAIQRKAAGISGLNDSSAVLAKNLAALSDGLYDKTLALDRTVNGAKMVKNPIECSEYYHKSVLPAMEALRKSADELELIVPRDIWPLPSYSELLFSI